ncbi:EAL domain-containing protein [Legionella bononiensis]|uniref:EAL domain-containing protein n=1 Tax=Legionella bononiensis TaxID=2793102 RepID=A0ABS1W8X6_9GAMM|nr:EAL domain-containing protein [Legionella bononiensis]MBL7479677.1 EAL domain-containing protein [Legionella bononiensis]MBL7525811.1 EAL domain-containing protein [Legionella bononiensis]MBL7561993.1 EAL domain-containing protein [Legionella bononiensis]
MDKITGTLLADLLLEKEQFIEKITAYQTLLKSLNPSLSNYADQSHSVFYELSIDLKTMLNVNQAIENLWRLPGSEVKNNIATWFNTIHPEDRALVKKALRNFVKSGEEEIALEYRLLYDDLSLCHITDKVILIKDNLGHAKSIMGIATDTTDYILSKKNLFIYEQILEAHTQEKNNNLFFDSMLKIISTSFDWDYSELWCVDEKKSYIYCTNTWAKNNNQNSKIYKESHNMKVKTKSDFNGYLSTQDNIVFITDISPESKYDLLRKASNCNYKSVLAINIRNMEGLLGQILFFSEKNKASSSLTNESYNKISYLLSTVMAEINSDKMLSYYSRHDNSTGLLNQYGFELAVKDSIDKEKNYFYAIVVIYMHGIEEFSASYSGTMGKKLFKKIIFYLQDRLLLTINCMAKLSESKIVLLTKKLINKLQIDSIIKVIQDSFINAFEVQGIRALLTPRLGISIFPDDSIDALALIHNANIASNYANYKESSSCAFYSTSLANSIKRSIEIENALRFAIAENLLHVLYQPKISLISGQITGVEALVRWHDPVLGDIAPSEFVNIAERSNLIISLNEWVFFEVINHFPMVELNLPVSINISANNLSPSYDFVAFVKKILKQLNIPGYFIDLELTEYQLAQDNAYSMKVLNKLRKEKITLSIDDFGTGFNSFEYLKVFKPEAVKIDKSFVDGIPHSLENMGIIRAVIALSKSLDIKTIAEGVETKEQLDCLIEEGCDEMQGFYYSRPVSIMDLKKLIKYGAGLNK